MIGKGKESVEVYTTPPPNFRPVGEAVGCFLESDGALLYLKRAASRPMPHTWGIPGGKLERGESPRAAIIREVFEETQIDIETPLLTSLGPLYIRRPDLTYIFHVFACPLPKRPSLQLNDEHTDARWATPAAALSLPLIPGGSATLTFYQTHRNPESYHGC